jgi:hypothetical protein
VLTIHGPACNTKSVCTTREAVGQSDAASWVMSWLDSHVNPCLFPLPICLCTPGRARTLRPWDPMKWQITTVAARARPEPSMISNYFHCKIFLSSSTCLNPSQNVGGEGPGEGKIGRQERMERYRWNMGWWWEGEMAIRRDAGWKITQRQQYWQSTGLKQKVSTQPATSNACRVAISPASRPSLPSDWLHARDGTACVGMEMERTGLLTERERGGEG